MDKGLITEQTLSDIASAIRDVYGEKDTYYPSEFAEKIRGLVIDPYAQGLWVDYGSGYVEYAITGTSIPNATFRRDTSLIRAKWNQCESIGTSAFCSCYSLAEVSFPACTLICSSGFRECSALTTVSFPACTSMSGSAFHLCTALTTANFPACLSIGGYAFWYCTSLTSVSFPACTNIGTYAFMVCSSLTSVSFPACTSIGMYAFSGCTNLESAYFMHSSVATLGNSNAFTNTPMLLSSYLGYYGSIYVPASLEASYKTANNWSYYSDRIVGI